MDFKFKKDVFLLTRIEARRITYNIDSFLNLLGEDEIVFDFTNTKIIHKDFIDELFRVQLKEINCTVKYKNANASIEKMINYAMNG